MANCSETRLAVYANSRMPWAVAEEAIPTPPGTIGLFLQKVEISERKELLPSMERLHAND